MLKYHYFNRTLNSKRLAIVVTNVCNLSCGGCHQLCGLFAKEQLWHMSPEQFRDSVNAATKWADANWGREGFSELDCNIGIYGGEPLVHPQWNELLDIMRQYKAYRFLVYTNGTGRKIQPDISVQYHEVNPGVVRSTTVPRILDGIVCRCNSTDIECMGLGDRFEVGYDMGHLQQGNVIARCKECGLYLEVLVTPPEVYRTEPEGNVQYLVAAKDRGSTRVFIPALVAPVDFDENRSKEECWAWARQNCFIWRECESAIYNGKAYFCIVAGALSHMFYGGQYGWSIDSKSNPMNRTDGDIDEQAQHFCYRCGFCGSRERTDSLVGNKQLACFKTYCSRTNYGVPKQDKIVQI